MPQWEQGQGAAGTLQECQGWVKRPHRQPQATKNWAWVAIELQEMRVVAQPPEAKVSGAAKPPPRVAELPQRQVGGSNLSPKVVPAWFTPPNLPTGHVLMAWQPPSPPPRWPHLSPGELYPPSILPPRAGEPALHPSRLGLATLPVQRVPYPGPSS